MTMTKFTKPAPKTLFLGGFLAIVIPQMGSAALAQSTPKPRVGRSSTAQAAPTQSLNTQASLIDDAKVKDRERLQKRQKRLDSLAPGRRNQEARDAAEDAPETEARSANPRILKPFGKVAATLFLYERDRSLTPDFEASEASFGLEGSQGRWSAKAEASLAEDAGGVGIANAFIGFTPWQGHEWRMGRMALAGINGYVADLNHHPSGLGLADGMSLAQTLEAAPWLSLTLGGGVANALSDDVTMSFKSRAGGVDRAAFGWGSVKISALKLEGTYAYQPNQIRVKDEEATKDLNEQRESHVSSWEFSGGLDFNYLAIGGFYGMKTIGSERYAVMGQSLPTDPAPEPLVQAWDVLTSGGGLTVKTPVAWSDQASEIIGTTFGYSISDTQGGKPEETEEILGVTCFYRNDTVSLSLNYANLQGQSGVKYTDPISQESFPDSDRVSFSASYSFK